MKNFLNWLFSGGKLPKPAWQQKIDNEEVASEREKAQLTADKKRKDADIAEALYAQSLKKHQAEFFCHVCGRVSSGPYDSTHEISTMGVPEERGGLEWDTPKDLKQCSCCHKWTCSTCLHKGICKTCAENL